MMIRSFFLGAWQGLSSGQRRGLVAALVAASLLLILSFVGPAEMQLVSVFALVGLLVVVQVVVLWTMWRQNPELRQARRAYMQGEFDRAISILEEVHDADKLEVMGSTLLGNAYRQVGRLTDSEAILRAAHEVDPASPFAAYGLGRTLLVMGQYEEGVSMIQHALDHRGQRIILADLGHAQFRAGDLDAAKASLKQADEIDLEPYRALMTRYLLVRLGQAPERDVTEWLSRYDHGLAVWQAEAERFTSTPYGVALAEDIAEIERMLIESP